MARGRKGDQRRVQSTLAASDYTAPGMENVANSVEGIKQQTEWYGKQRAQIVDISAQMENIYTLQQDQTREMSKMYGIEKDLLDLLQVRGIKEKIIEQNRKLLKDISLEEQNIIKDTISEFEEYNQQAKGVAAKTKE